MTSNTKGMVIRMESLFIHALNVSITASFLVIAIIIYRRIAKGAPRWVSALLWGLVGLRLLLPFDIESDVSLIPSKATIPDTITHDKYPALDTGIAGVDELVNPILSSTMSPSSVEGATPMHSLILALGRVCRQPHIGMAACTFPYIDAAPCPSRANHAQA